MKSQESNIHGKGYRQAPSCPRMSLDFGARGNTHAGRLNPSLQCGGRDISLWDLAQSWGRSHFVGLKLVPSGGPSLRKRVKITNANLGTASQKRFMQVRGLKLKLHWVPVKSISARVLCSGQQLGTSWLTALGLLQKNRSKCITMIP